MKNELNRCRDKLDFCKAGVVILCVVIMLLSAMLYFCRSAHASGFAEVGQSNYSMPPNMLWWQDVDRYEIRQNMTDNYLRAGYEWPVGKNFGFRASAFSLGQYSLYAEVNTDELCVVRHGKDSKSNCGPSEGVETRGNIRGLAISAVARTSGETRLFAEGGVTWNQQSFHLYQCSLCFNLKNTYNETRSGGGYMFALGIERGPWSVSVFYYNSNIGVFDSGNIPSGIGEVRGWSIGYRF